MIVRKTFLNKLYLRQYTQNQKRFCTFKRIVFDSTLIYLHKIFNSSPNLKCTKEDTQCFSILVTFLIKNKSWHFSRCFCQSQIIYNYFIDLHRTFWAPTRPSYIHRRVTFLKRKYTTQTDFIRIKSIDDIEGMFMQVQNGIAFKYTQLKHKFDRRHLNFALNVLNFN